MGKGARPSREFVEGVPGRVIRSQDTLPQKPSKPFPEVRIIQDAVFNIGDGWQDLGDEYAEGWVNYLNKVGFNNKGKGVVRSLGSVSVTIVSATEINKMMDRKYGERYRRREQAQKLLRALNGRLREFLYAERIQAGDERARELYAQLEPTDGFSFDNEIEPAAVPENADGLWVPGSVLTSPRQRTIEEKMEIETELRRHLFGEVVYYPAEADELQTFGKKKFGIDLSPNPEIERQREALQTYFRREEGFDVGLMDDGREAHATVFDLYPQYTTDTVRELKTGGAVMPAGMTFDAVRLDSSGDNAILFE